MKKPIVILAAMALLFTQGASECGTNKPQDTGPASLSGIVEMKSPRNDDPMSCWALGVRMETQSHLEWICAKSEAEFNSVEIGSRYTR